MKLVKKDKILEYLEDAKYRNWHNPYPISWNIKMYDWSFESGKCEHGEEVNPKYDEEWEQYLEDTPEFFNWACEDCLGWITDENGVVEGHPDPRLAEIPYKMGTTGRSGGWLVLTEYYGYQLWRQCPDWEEWEYEDLWILYKFCKEVDVIVNSRTQAMAYEYNFRRFQKEQEEWIPRDRELEAAKEESSGISMPVLHPAQGG